jgi:hypothetical protein
MAIHVCFIKCGACKVFLLRDPDVGGDYVAGILHSWCPDCGLMHGPYSLSPVVKPVSKRKARGVAIKIATRHKLNFINTCEIAMKCVPNGIEEFANEFIKRLDKRIPQEEVVTALL